MRHHRAAVLIAAVVLSLFAGCGDGEDRPGQVTSENNDGASGSVSASGAGSESASGSSAGGEHGDGHDDADDSKAAFSDGEEDTTVDVTLKDYAFVGVPASVQGPNVLFKATVEGSNAHELEVLDDAGEAVGEIHSFEAPAAKELAVALKPGTYTLQCLVEEGAKTHAELGMKQTLTVS